MEGPRSLTRCVACALVALVCGCKRELPPLGEALIVVDTDAPAPRLAGRLRVDLYADDGTWFESRDVARPNAGDWPASFSVYLQDGQPARAVIVRLRVYPEGKVRDYRGEVFTPRPAPDARPADPVTPGTPTALNLVKDGVDVTPIAEPQPALAIDRLLRVHLTPGVRGSARVTMRGECFGTMADLIGRATCVDTENALVPMPDVPLDANMSIPTKSDVVGTFGADTPCAGSPRTPTPGLDDDEVCIPGGAFVFGNPSEFGGDLDGVPERVAVLSPFYVDRFEVTVARWRKAVGEGLSTRSPVANEGPLAPDATDTRDTRDCTWSASPRGRETYALTCVLWPDARAFCQHIGGDLVTEAQWEYVAQAQGREVKTGYPWGDDEPTCDRAVFARLLQGNAFVTDADKCGRTAGYGPLPVDARAGAGGDVSPTGVVNLAGGVAELAFGVPYPLGSNCWALAGLHDPVCTDPATRALASRGGGWATNVVGLRAAYRYAIASGTVFSTVHGFRCVRPAGGP